MGIRTRLAELVGGSEWQGERDKIKQGMDTLMGAYLDGPYQLPPGELIRQLKEYDSAILHDLVIQLEYERLGSYATNANDIEAERLRVVQEVRRLWKYDPLADWIIQTWTNFGFGENIVVTPNDEGAAVVWDEFWTANRNEPLLAADNQQELSDTVLIDGEFFFALYIAKIDGKVTLRTFATDEITEIVTAKDDKRVTLFYKRAWTDERGMSREAFYPDAFVLMTDEYTQEMDEFIEKNRTKRIDTDNESTAVAIVHVSHNRKGSIRGWPIMSTGTAWIRAHKQFRENRTSVAAGVAMFINKLKVQGGSRSLDSAKAKLQSSLTASQFTDKNPPGAAGSTWLENQSADLSRLPLGTGASDAKEDGNALLMMAGLSGGLFPHWLGAGEAFRLATATSMEVPLLRNFSRYQQFWASQFRRLVRVVLWASNEYNGTSFDDFGADVNIDTLLETDIEVMTTNATTYMAQVSAMQSANLMQQEEAKRTVNYLNRVLLEAFGSENVNDIAPEDEKYFNEQPPEPTPPPVVPEQSATPPDETLPIPQVSEKSIKRIAKLRERVLAMVGKE